RRPRPGRSGRLRRAGWRAACSFPAGVGAAGGVGRTASGAGDPMKVLVLHNRYRVHGGEEQAVDLHLEALRLAGVPNRALMRDSSEAGRARAATAMLRGGDDPSDVAAAVRELGATVVHAHNMQPLFGPRSLAAARAEG